MTAAALWGCAAPSTYVGRGPHPQIVRGTPIPPLDFLASLLSIDGKILLWNWNFNSHSMSKETEEQFVKFLEARHRQLFDETLFRVNQYAPVDDLRHLVKNRYMAWPYRLLLGLPTTLLVDVLLPGRIIPWGDYYNPYTNVAHLYSNEAVVAMHEAGHAYDFADFPYKGTYALIRSVPFMDLYQEKYATNEAITYLIEVGDREAEYRAYRVLWPAYGTYMGSYVPLVFGSAIGAVGGHIAAYFKVRSRKQFYRRMDKVLGAGEMPQAVSQSQAAASSSTITSPQAAP